MNEDKKKPTSVNTFSQNYLKPFYLKPNVDHRPSELPPNGGQSPEPFQPRLLDRAKASSHKTLSTPGLLIVRAIKANRLKPIYKYILIFLWTLPLQLSST